MTTTTFIIIWATGLTPSYLIGRWSKKKSLGGRWTIGDRQFMIVLCLLTSWFSILGSLAAYLVLKTADKNEPASW